jgi:hypothetical protein
METASENRNCFCTLLDLIFYSDPPENLPACRSPKGEGGTPETLGYLISNLNECI